MKAAYDACLNEDLIKEAGTGPLRGILHQILALFPTETQGDLSARRLASGDKTAIRKTVGFLAELGISALVSTGTGADDRDPDTVVVSVAPPYRIGLPAKERYEDDQVVARYQTVLTQVLSALFPDQHDPNTTYHSVVEFEKRLASASPNAEDREDVTVRTPLDDLSLRY